MGANNNRWAFSLIPPPFIPLDLLPRAAGDVACPLTVSNEVSQEVNNSSSSGRFIDTENPSRGSTKGSHLRSSRVRRKIAHPSTIAEETANFSSSTPIARSLLIHNSALKALRNCGFQTGQRGWSCRVMKKSKSNSPTSNHLIVAIRNSTSKYLRNSPPKIQYTREAFGCLATKFH